jgi:hypothetical protein
MERRVGEMWRRLELKATHATQMLVLRWGQMVEIQALNQSKTLDTLAASIKAQLWGRKYSRVTRCSRGNETSYRICETGAGEMRPGSGGLRTRTSNPE